MMIKLYDLQLSLTLIYFYTNQSLKYVLLESHILKDELEKLEQITRIKTEYKIVWTPKIKSKKEGDVLGKIIYIYSCDLEDAVHTLQHEFFDILVCRTNKPYVEVINTLLSVISEKTYQEKEKVVEILVRLTGCSDLISAKNDLAVA